MKRIEEQIANFDLGKLKVVMPDDKTMDRALIQARLNLTRKRIKKIRGETLHLYQELPSVEGFHESRQMWRIIIGSNRSGKTLCAAKECAAALSGIDPKYPSKNGRALFVGRDGDHLASPMAQKLLRPGAIKLIPDEHTGELRALRPNPADLTRLDDYDESYRELWRDSPPLLPPRLVKSVAWEDRAKGIPRIVTMKNGWTALWRSSQGVPPQGDVYHLGWLDEHVINDDFYVQMTRGFTDVNGLGIWSATPEMTSWQLLELRQKGKSGLPSVGIWELMISDNPYLTSQQKAAFFDALPEDKRATHFYGVPAVASSLVYGHIDIMGVHGCEPFEIPKTFTRYLFVDPGRKLCATILCAIPPDERFMYFYDLLLVEHSTAEEWARRVKDKQDEQGVGFEAVVMDCSAGRQHHAGGESAIAQFYMDAAERAGVHVRTKGPMYGAFPGSRNVQGRQEALLATMEIRGEQHVLGTSRLRVFRGRFDELERQMRKARVSQKDPKRRDAMKLEDVLVCAEYGAAFDPYYYPPQPVVAKETNPVWERFQHKLEKRRQTAGSGITL